MIACLADPVSLPEMGRALLVTAYHSGAPRGKNLGTAGYSYDFVVRLFEPLLRQCGTVALTAGRAGTIERAAREAAAAGRTAVHLGFLPFQDVRLAEGVPNVVVPAWEFPDVPDHAFDGNPQNDWVATANRCAGVIVGGPFTADALRRGGVWTPIHVVPVPTPADYYHLPLWKPHSRTALDCSYYSFQNAAAGPSLLEPLPVAPQRSGVAVLRRLLLQAAKGGYRQIVRRLAPAWLDASITAAVRTAWSQRRDARALRQHRPERGLSLGGVVYTSIFNPLDGRKNWEDLMTGFLLGLRDRADATLVLKLIVNCPRATQAVLNHYHRLGISHRCRLVVIPDFLSDRQMVELVSASTYYLTTTRAEGNCLPLMDYLAAARPAVAPAHTAIGDYFDRRSGFVIESHPEPAAWPQDRRLRCTTTWHRIVWTSLVEQLQASYQLATERRPEYVARAQQARRIQSAWSHPDAVLPRLRAALDAVAAGPAAESADEPPQIIPFQSHSAASAHSRAAA